MDTGERRRSTDRPATSRATEAAAVAHIRTLFEQLQALPVRSPAYDALVTVIGEHSRAYLARRQESA